MFLDKFDINQQLKSQFNTFLNSNISFYELKALLTGKKTIPVVHSQLVDMLLERKRLELINILAKKQDYLTAMAALEFQDENKSSAYDSIYTAVTTEGILDDVTQRADDQFNDRLIREREEKQQARTRLEQQLLVNELIVQVLGPTKSVVYQHPPTYINSFEVKCQIETDIATLTNRIIDIERDLSGIAKRANERNNRREEREAHLNAVIKYHQKRPLDLSNHYKNNPNRDIHEKCNGLITEADQLNYSVFLEQFELYLEHNNRPAQEIEALGKVLQLMKQHLVHEQKVAKLQSKLNSTLVTIVQDEQTLELTQQKLIPLIQVTSDLTTTNERLKNENIELSKSQEENTQTRNRLLYPTLILTGAGLLAAIPLILTLVGVIPYFIVPPLLLTLVITPPVLLLAVGIGFGIATLAYAIKGMLNNFSITTNEKTISDNLSRMDTEVYDMDIIQKDTIPELEVRMADNLRNKEKLTASLNQAKKLVEHTLNQANGIEITQYASSSLFSQANVRSVTSGSDYSPSTSPEDGVENAPVFS